ncbi:hypothetical protein Hanom_Chr14g01268071 [Helianthus anomalus]
MQPSGLTLPHSLPNHTPLPPPNPRLTSTFVTAPPRQTTFNTAARPSETPDHRFSIEACPVSNPLST